MRKYLIKIFTLSLLFILISLTFNFKFELALTVLENLPNEVKFVDIAAGYSHSLALDENGNIWSWGDYESIKMIQVDGVKFRAISAGTESSLAIDTNGNLWGWGQTLYETTSISRQPIKIMEGTKFKKIAACWNYNLVIDEDGNLWAWGANSDGQLGIGNTTGTYTPTKVKEGTKFKEVAGNYHTSFAIDVNNNLWSWGCNQSLGIGTDTTVHSTPVQVKKGTKFENVAAGEIHALALDTSSNLWAWGSGGNGVGDGTTNVHYTPVQIKRGTTFKEISGGDEYSLAIDTSGNLWAWGLNNKGQVGNNTQITVLSPTHIMDGTKFIKVAAGRQHSLALSEDGDLWVWGSNESKQLTTSSITNSLIPLKITSKKVEYTVTFMDGTEVVKTENVISGGSATAPTLTKDGYTLSWDKDFSNVTSNLTVNAIWTPNSKNTVIINTSEGEIEVGYDDEENISLPQNLSKPGYTFDGWYDNSDFSGDKITQITLDDAQNKTYYAKWKQFTNKVTINTSEGEIEVGYDDEENISLPQDLSKPGYTFDGWYDNSDLSGDKITQITLDDAQNKTYYAKWDVNKNTDENHNTNNSNNVENIAPGVLPQTGIQVFQMFILISVLGIIMIISFTKYKNLNI